MRPSVLVLTAAVASVLASLALAQTPPATEPPPAAPAAEAAPAPATPAAAGRGALLGGGRGAALLAGRGGRGGVAIQQPTAERFDAADANKDGKLDAAEFGKTMDERVSQLPQIAAALFRSRDKNMDGFVSKEEFTAAVGPIGGGLAGRGGRGGALNPPATAAPTAPVTETPPTTPAPAG